jgi:hypothetical protein
MHIVAVVSEAVVSLQPHNSCKVATKNGTKSEMIILSIEEQQRLLTSQNGSTL